MSLSLKYPKILALQGSISVFKLALIGKNISHSLSPGIYKKIIGNSIKYDLIDIKKEEELPRLDELKKIYRGINITTPYKKSYLNQVDTDDLSSQLGAINCISFKSDTKGTNTDYFAVRDIFYDLKNKYLIENIFILGGGIMSQITQFFFDYNSLDYKVFSRQSGNNIAQMDFSDHRNSLIINTCSREFEFSGQINKTSIFWDYNYSFRPHQSYFDQNDQSFLYQDGHDLLYAQAKYSTYFWGVPGLNH